jgi:hypothetical protein
VTTPDAVPSTTRPEPVSRRDLLRVSSGLLAGLLATAGLAGVSASREAPPAYGGGTYGGRGARASRIDPHA